MKAMLLTILLTGCTTVQNPNYIYVDVDVDNLTISAGVNMCIPRGEK